MWQALLGDLCDVSVFQLGADKLSPCYEILQSAAIATDHDKAISINFTKIGGWASPRQARCETAGTLPQLGACKTDVVRRWLGIQG